MSTGRSVAGSVDELIAGATSREPYKTADSLSGAVLEQVVIDGISYVLKHFDHRGDWVLRASGDAGIRSVACWELGLYDAVAPDIDAAVVGAARAPGRPGAGALLMRDIGPHLVPSGGEPVPAEWHDGFLRHMAEQHAAMWGWTDDVGLMPMTTRFQILTPTLATAELSAGPSDFFTACRDGWRQLAALRPHLGGAAHVLAIEPWPLVDAMAQTPSTFLQGDWKLGNLGRHPDGRTILLDWDRPGAGPPLFDLTWYLAVNCDRMPESKEQAIEAYRGHLERCGVDTEPWWQRQLDLCLLGAYVQLGWSKTGDPDELAWWDAPCARALDLLGWPGPP